MTGVAAAPSAPPEKVRPNTPLKFAVEVSVSVATPIVSWSCVVRTVFDSLVAVTSMRDLEHDTTPETLAVTLAEGASA